MMLAWICESCAKRLTSTVIVVLGENDEYLNMIGADSGLTQGMRSEEGPPACTAFAAHRA